MSFLMNTQKNILAVEFEISNNKELFRQLYEKKAGIEAAAGVELDWRELTDRKMSRILYETKVDFSDKDKWNEQFAWIMEYSVIDIFFSMELKKIPWIGEGTTAEVYNNWYKTVYQPVTGEEAGEQGA